MRHLLAATCLTPVALSLAFPAHAETVIADARTTPVRTSTIAGGAPDDIRISAQGSVKPPSGVAVTIDSNDGVTNQGTIQISGANDSTGILAEAGRSGSITNSGKIILDENYTATDADNDGDLDGPFAQGVRRFGIRVQGGGTFSGNIVQGGDITVEGNQSAGIQLDGRLNGSLSNSGKIDVIGDASFGIRTQDVSGNVNLTGTIQTRGANSVAVAIDGNVGGRLTVQGSIASSGYRSTQAPSDTSKLDADDLLQGGPALRIAGNVSGGILFDAPPPNNSATDNDEDDDGVADAQEGTASIRSFGAAPAVQIGSATRDVAIGAVAGNTSGHGLIVRGAIGAEGVYSGVTATGLSIGGLGGQVTIAGGMTNAGTIEAQATGAAATAVRLQEGAVVPTVVNSGIIGARGGGGTSAGAIIGIAVDAGADVTSIRNSGSITATAAGTQATATAIRDASGTLDLVENSGRIGASSGTAAVAIDLRANDGGTVVRQIAGGQGSAAPQINGDILFGDGDDLLEVTAGSVTGISRFGAGADRLTLSGNSLYSGTVDFGGGDDLLDITGTSRFAANLVGSSGVAVNVNGGSLDVANTGTVALSSLSVTGNGAIRVNIDGAAGTSTLYDVAGSASFATGSRLLVGVTSTESVEGDYVVVEAGSLTGGSNLALSTVLPFLYVGAVTGDDEAGEVSLNIRRKTAGELGLNSSEASAYSAVYAVLAEDEAIEDVFLSVSDGGQFRSALGQMLPNHAGGVFETVTQGSRATARFLADPRPPLFDMGGWGFFIQQVGWGRTKDIGDTAAYDISGWGVAGGAEIQAGSFGAFGLSLGYLLGEDADGSNDNEVDAEQVELAAHWRGGWGPLRAYARASGARISFDSLRTFTAGGLAREARGEWNGTLWSAAAGLSYELRSGRLTVRPLAALDYYSLREDGYTETGGGQGFGLIVDRRSGDELAASGTLTLGYDLGGMEPDGGFFRIEAEGGRRQIVGGSLDPTVARFANGQPFALAADERTSGWLGRLRVIGGNGNLRVGGEASAEERDGDAAVAFRLSLHTAF